MAQILYSGMGGHGSVAFSLIDADSNANWQPLMGFFGIEPLSPAYAEKCRRRGIPFEYFPALPGKSWRAWPQIFRWLAAARPDEIILHSVTALLPCLLFARKGKTRVVVVEHQPNALKSPSEWVFSRAAMLLADRVIVLTHDYDQEMRKRLGLFYRAKKVQIIPNGIDTSRFGSINHSPNQSGSIRLGMAARFTGTKRQDVLVEMFEELRRREPQIDWRLSLAGDGVNREHIKRITQAKGLSEYVNFPGRLNEEALIEWYNALNIYLHASEGETLSTSLLQAMASALPIVASNVSGISNLVSGVTTCGVLVEGQSSHGFADSVIRLIKEPNFAAALGASARRLVEQSYGHNQMFAMYMSLFDK